MDMGIEGKNLFSFCSDWRWQAAGNNRTKQGMVWIGMHHEQHGWERICV
jgi:hypothetical protein